MCTRHKTWPQTQRLLPPSLTHHASCCLWVGFIFMPFCLSWQTGGSGVHRQHHFDHASSHQHQHHFDHCIIASASLCSVYHLINITIQSSSLWSLHHLISITVIIASLHHFYCDYFIISITVISASSHQHHCDHASPASLFTGSVAMCAGGRDDEWWWDAMLWLWSLWLSSDRVSGMVDTDTANSESQDWGYPGQCQHKISCRIYNCSIENAVWTTWYNFSDVGH